MKVSGSANLPVALVRSKKVLLIIVCIGLAALLCVGVSAYRNAAQSRALDGFIDLLYNVDADDAANPEQTLRALSAFATDDFIARLQADNAIPFQELSQMDIHSFSLSAECIPAPQAQLPKGFTHRYLLQLSFYNHDDNTNRTCYRDVVYFKVSYADGAWKVSDMTQLDWYEKLRPNAA